MSKAKFRNLEKYGLGWKFEMINEDDWTGKEVVTECRTNREGEGLWCEQATNTDYADGSGPVYQMTQIEGTAQFDLPSDKDDALRKLDKEFNWDY